MALISASAAATSCVASTFQTPVIAGLKIVSITAAVVGNWSQDVPQGVYGSHDAWNVTGLDFCNVSVISTHPGWGDSINSQIWFPLQGWNGRLQYTGGGGLVSGLSVPAMTAALADGYASVSTDGGHGMSDDLSRWGLYGPGDANLYNVANFGGTALHEAVVVGKALTRDFYGRDAAYSYYNGCSTGGGQGLMFAQDYPEDFDGIIAAAPALGWNDLVIALFYPSVYLQDVAGGFPNRCELAAITAAAVKACDPKDGVVDDIVSAPDLCDFDPFSLVGTSVPCGGTGTVNVSRVAAVGARGVWSIDRRNGTVLWEGFNQQAAFDGLMNTTTDAVTGVSEPLPFPPAEQWVADMIRLDPSYDWRRGNYSIDQMYADLRSPQNRLYSGVLPGKRADLSTFRDAGGKMITWHGMADNYIPTAHSQNYYERVERLDPAVRDYYRYFQAPGVAHCLGGPGPYPGQTLKSLVTWVEHGQAPDSLAGVSLPNANGTVYERPICMYPLRAKYTGHGDVTQSVNWECR
jgi:feruloyl esterase